MAILEKGNFVTVDKWIHRKDTSYCGDLLEVLHIEGDFIKVQRHDKFIHNCGHLTLDRRQAQIIVVSDYFAEMTIAENKRFQGKDGEKCKNCKKK
jgi:hypothetical protein